MAGGILLDGLFYGKLPIVGKKDWLLYYIELSDKHFHIYEGNESPSRSRKHLQSLELHCSDKAGQDGRDKKTEYRFFYDRGSGGRYVFKCQKAEQRQEWVMSLQKLIQKRDYLDKGYLVEDITASLPTSPTLTEVNTPLPPIRTTTLPNNNRITPTMDTPPPPPPHNRPSPFQKRDSGFVSGTGVVSRSGGYRSGSADGEICHMSGDSAVVHNTAVKLTKQSNSADGSFMHKADQLPDEDEDDLHRYEWYWGEMSREECGKNLKEKGEIGNFVVRKNDRGNFVMSFWRKDGIHHHRILRNGDKYRFEKSAVDAEGLDISDLLDTYMKHCTDKTIGPYGGQLFPTYDQAWNPPEIDFDKFEKVLNKKADETGAKRIFKPGLEMVDNTYGGMSLDQIKKAIEKSDIGGLSAKLKPPTTKPSPTKPSPKLSPKPTPLKKHKPSPQTPKSPIHVNPRASIGPGYVNLFPPQAQKYENSHMRSPSTEYSEDEEEEEQEVYIAPGELDTSDDPPIYENHTPSLLTTKTNYANFPFNSTPIDDESGIYQNVTTGGKPFTPPRQVRPSPQVKPRHK